MAEVRVGAKLYIPRTFEESYSAQPFGQIKMDWFLADQLVHQVKSKILKIIVIKILILNFHFSLECSFTQSTLKAKNITHDLNQDSIFTAATIHCGCQNIKSLSRVLGIQDYGINNFGNKLTYSVKEALEEPFECINARVDALFIEVFLEPANM